MHLGLCLDSCDDVFQTQCLAARFNDWHEVIGQFGTCQVLNVGMKGLMVTEGETDCPELGSSDTAAKLSQPNAWTLPDP